jgi:hypothetical protein
LFTKNNYAAVGRETKVPMGTGKKQDEIFHGVMLFLLPVRRFSGGTFFSIDNAVR